MLWWVLSPDHAGVSQKFNTIFKSDRNWGIGFETVTMVVTIVTAIIAIFTLTHELFKEPNSCRAYPSPFSNPTSAPTPLPTNEPPRVSSGLAN
jgi:hypothetical protein